MSIYRNRRPFQFALPCLAIFLLISNVEAQSIEMRLEVLQKGKPLKNVTLIVKKEGCRCAKCSTDFGLNARGVDCTCCSDQMTVKPGSDGTLNFSVPEGIYDLLISLEIDVERLGELPAITINQNGYPIRTSPLDKYGYDNQPALALAIRKEGCRCSNCKVPCDRCCPPQFVRSPKQDGSFGYVGGVHPGVYSAVIILELKVGRETQKLSINID